MMMKENSGHLRAGAGAGAGAGALAAVMVLLRPRVCVLGVVTAMTPGVPDAPRD